MLELVVDNAYCDLSTQEKMMADRITVAASKSETTITRLVTGVELALKQSGKHWTLSVKPEKSK
jgi:hypothetical protein